MLSSIAFMAHAARFRQDAQMGAAENLTPVPDFSDLTPNEDAFDATVDMMDGAGVNNTDDYIDIQDVSFQNGIIDSLFLNQLALSKLFTSVVA